MDLDDTYTYDRYWWDLKVDTRSRSQGQRSRSYTVICENIVWAITHEQTNESWWSFVNWWVMLRGKIFDQIYCVHAQAKLGATPVRIKCFLPINHEWLDGSWWYLHIWLILMRRWSWHKVKVTRSKVKVIYVSMWKYSLGYSSWTNEWILMKLCELVSYA